MAAIQIWQSIIQHTQQLEVSPFSLPLQGGFNMPIRHLAVLYKTYQTSVVGPSFKVPLEVVAGRQGKFAPQSV